MKIDLLQDCTDTLLDQLDNELKATEDECKVYRFVVMQDYHC